MTQEDKDLLLKDLCMRLPYGLVCFVKSVEHPEILSAKENISFNMLGVYVQIIKEETHIIKPYLRQMSSMTEEEKKEYNSYHSHPDNIGDSPWFYIDWLNEHHFDYRGLIEKGLALEASEGMYD